ncbi:electron transfer flavoprotein subunit beta/FixA family protein [Desulfospira joergensenii]|uniref:electron transfer flavoprotein subunit beta/FixA family protein n=1 Tax=Desulfospira joergensenii TaxID=53329 RepID=UPI0003B4AD6E|nr:electron transfer flavoprotein subunit beta/FixA family protein [Desulfospira joergensenii]
MKIICVVKYVPDVDSIAFDAENNTYPGKNIRMILNPDDACALAFALQVKAGDPDCFVEVVTMGTFAVRPHMEDLLRLGIDRGTLICDPVFEGSDTFVTSEVLGRYIATRPFDCLLTGNLSLDGGTSHVPVQLAETLGLDQMLGIVRIDLHRFDSTRAVFDVVDEKSVTTYEMAMPCVLSVTRESGYKLPYVKLKDMQREVSDELAIVTNKDLCFSETEVGSFGSPTQVVKTYPKTFEKRKRQIVQNDEEGISYVFDFLKQKGFL